MAWSIGFRRWWTPGGQFHRFGRRGWTDGV